MMSTAGKEMIKKFTAMLGVTMAFGTFGSVAQADTIGSYMTIVNNIPKMAMQPDDQSQAWVRSARNILKSTDETMAETVLAMNRLAEAQGRALFCFSGVSLDSERVDELIQSTYAELLKDQSTSSKMPVAQVLVMGLNRQYPCSGNGAAPPSRPQQSQEYQPQYYSAPQQQQPQQQQYQQQGNNMLPPPQQGGGMQGSSDNMYQQPITQQHYEQTGVSDGSTTNDTEQQPPLPPM